MAVNCDNLLVWSVQINQVPSNLNLHEILLNLKENCKTIFAIYRDFDFRHVLSGPTVFISLISRSEAEYIIQNGSNLLNNRFVNAQFAQVSAISLKLIKCIVPISQRTLMLANINVDSRIEELSDILSLLTSFFCDNITVTSCRLIIDKRRFHLRNFAFVDCVTIDDVMHFDNMELTIGENIKLNSDDKYGEAMLEANLLSTTVETVGIEARREFLQQREVIGGARPNELEIRIQNEIREVEEPILLINEHVDLGE
ncbi:hypothetical protein PVAND_017598 [Polypedilum vanderplanki]|uniref:Uncharacterized protein n=1 Tax=Polypedilum vanderplanki TaxID=319348 RepID=A0A9J6B9M6_POLVA|nr:hypothetical protein PVAND_017598 [Polypedilum vanderplanki]